MNCCIIATSGRHLPTLVRLVYKITNYNVFVIPIGVDFKELEMIRGVQILEVIHKSSSNIFIKMLKYLQTQLKVLQRIISIWRTADIFIFFVGGELLFIPVIALKLLRKKVVMMPAGVVTKVYAVKKDAFYKFLSLLTSINFSLADKIIVYSGRLLQELGIENYASKVIIAHEHFVNFAKFTVEKKISERPNMVGYIGRLSEEKGVLNLIEAVPLVLMKRADICFMIIGGGNLSDEIIKIIRANGLQAHVKLTGQVSHNDVPRYLNELKLLVLPSFTEGLPNVILEAMACGTPVLATPIGAIPDIVKDGETGFLLKSNDPKHIANRIIELLGKPKLLEKVSVSAYNYVRENFSYEKTLEAWRKILSELELSK